MSRAKNRLTLEEKVMLLPPVALLAVMGIHEIYFDDWWFKKG
jgi:hypothetical protein